MSNITAVVLAGGIGKRFLPFIHDKTLFPFMGQSLLERTLRMVERAGIQDVIITTNPFNAPWVEANRTRFALNITTHAQQEPKGMGDAMLTLKHILPSTGIIVMNAGDMVGEHLLPELIDRIGNHDVVLTGLETPTYQPLGYFSLDNDRITGIIEKPGAENMPSNLANLVFHYFADPKDFVTRIEAATQNATPESDDIYEQALNTLMNTKSVGFYRYVGPWQKLKFGYHVLDMSEFFLKNLKGFVDPTAQVSSTAVLNDRVHVGAGAKIMDGAVIQGPCFIGPNVIVGNNALVRQSIVEENSVIGFGSEIVRSYIGGECDLHHAYVGDSVLEEKVHFGYGAHTANFRLDKGFITVKQFANSLESTRNKLGVLMAKKVEVGVNVSFLPGVTVGTNVFIYPGAIVHSAIPDSHILKYVQTQEVVRKEKKQVEL
jgi:NDP-sugar pyrophosphorylase family protein